MIKMRSFLRLFVLDDSSWVASDPLLRLSRSTDKARCSVACWLMMLDLKYSFLSLGNAKVPHLPEMQG